MPIALVIFAFALLLLLAFLALSLPLSLLLRFRAGTVRRRGRGWVAGINFFAASISSLFLLIGAGVSNAWIPHAFTYTALGWLLGGMLGILGLVITRWESTPMSLHYSPNKILMLSLTLVVTARIYYGFWRMWHAWRSTPADESWLAASGAAGSMAAGAVVLGYYAVYWLGLRRRLHEHAKGISIQRRA